MYLVQLSVYLPLELIVIFDKLTPSSILYQNISHLYAHLQYLELYRTVRLFVSVSSKQFHFQKNINFCIAAFCLIYQYFPCFYFSCHTPYSFLDNIQRALQKMCSVNTIIAHNPNPLQRNFHNFPHTRAAHYGMPLSHANLGSYF